MSHLGSLEKLREEYLHGAQHHTSKESPPSGWVNYLPGNVECQQDTKYIQRLNYRIFTYALNVTVTCRVFTTIGVKGPWVHIVYGAYGSH